MCRRAKAKGQQENSTDPHMIPLTTQRQRLVKQFQAPGLIPAHLVPLKALCPSPKWLCLQQSHSDTFDDQKVSRSPAVGRSRKPAGHSQDGKAAS